MRAFLKLSALFALSAIAIGCIHPVRNTNLRMQSWIGHHESELIRAWGPASATSPDGAGGHILIYYFDKTHTTPDTRQTTTVTTTGPYASCPVVGGVVQNCQNTQARSITRTVGEAPRQSGYIAQRMFYVNSGGVIYHWRWQGL